MRAPGETYAKASIFRTRGDEEFDAAGARQPLFDPALVEEGRYLESGASVYAEHGLTRDVTLVASVLIKVADIEAVDRQVTSDVRALSFGIPDLRFGARLPLTRGKVVAALEPGVTLPLQAVERRTDDSPRIGGQSTSFALGASIGTSLPTGGGYVQAGGGYRARSGKPPDEWFGDAEMGMEIASPFRIRFRWDTVDARNVKAGGAEAVVVAAESGSQDLHRIAPTLAIASRGGSEFSFTWRRVVSGRSALRSSEIEVAFAFLGTTSR